MKVGGGSGVLLLSGEAFGWRPWEAGGGQKYKLVNEKGQFEVGEEGWGVLSLIWPKPGMSISPPAIFRDVATELTLTFARFINTGIG